MNSSISEQVSADRFLLLHRVATVYFFVSISGKEVGGGADLSINKYFRSLVVPRFVADVTTSKSDDKTWHVRSGSQAVKCVAGKQCKAD